MKTAYFGGGTGGGAGAVTSVFSRIGAVVAALNDYAASLVDNDSGVSGATVADALDALNTAIGALNSDDIANVSDVDGATVTAALDTLGLGAFLRGADLSGSATNDLTRALGTFFVMMPQQTTAANTINLQTTGLTSTEAGFNFAIAIYDQDDAVTIINKGPLNNTVMVVPAGELRLMFFQWDGLNFAITPGWGDLEPL